MAFFLLAPDRVNQYRSGEPCEGCATHRMVYAWRHELAKDCSAEVVRNMVRISTPCFAGPASGRLQTHRLHGISTVEAANAYAPSFIAAYNARFAKPLRDDEKLDVILTWREPRRVTKSLTV